MAQIILLAALILAVSFSIAQKSQFPDFGDPKRFVQLGEIRPKFSFVPRQNNNNIIEINNDVPTPIASVPLPLRSNVHGPPEPAKKMFGAVHVRATNQPAQRHLQQQQQQQAFRPFVRPNQAINQRFANDFTPNQAGAPHANNNDFATVKNRRAVLQNDFSASSNLFNSNAPIKTIAIAGKPNFIANNSNPGSRSLFGPFGGPGGPPPPGAFIGGPADGALIGGGPFPPPPPGGFVVGGPGVPLSNQNYYKYEHFLTQTGPFQHVHSKIEKRNEGQSFDPITGVHQFNNGEGQVRDFDNAAALSLGRGFAGFGGAPFIGGGPIEGAEFTGQFPGFIGGGGGPGPLIRGGGPVGLPPNCDCRLIADCRDVSALARQLPVSGPNDPTACLPGYVPCCAEPHFESSSAPLIGGPPPLPLEPIGGPLRNGPIESFIAPPPPPIIAGPPPPPPPPYVVKPEGCGLKGTNPLARVLDIEATDPKFADAEFGEFPWMAAILRSDHTYACGGALIKPRAVLTAAHCVSKLKFDDIIVRLGEYDVESTQELPYQDVLVTQVVIHGGYHSGTLANDLAILILAEPSRLSSYIRPVCLPPFHDYLSFKCTVTGWGKNLPNGMFSRVLKKVDLPIVDHGFCENEYRKSPELGPFFNLDSSFVCAGAPGKDACYGDGGAPLVCEFEGFWRLVGLVSWGIGCGQYPGVYADITKFVPWIYDVFAKYSFLA